MNYEQTENCQFSSGFPCIPNNYKMNATWQMVGSTPNPIPSVGTWQGNSGYYPPSAISEEMQDPFVGE